MEVSKHFSGHSHKSNILYLENFIAIFYVSKMRNYSMTNISVIKSLLTNGFFHHVLQKQIDLQITVCGMQLQQLVYFFFGVSVFFFNHATKQYELLI